MASLRLIFVILSLLGSLVAGAADCFPVPFDHFWFRVDQKTYKKIGSSTYFQDERFSFYEPNKSPLGTYYGHYLTGTLHNLEIFEEAMPAVPEPIGIGFLSERAGCLTKIHAKLSKLKARFTLKPDADWGRFTELEKNKSLAIWVSELKPSYVGAPDGAINRAAWMKKIRLMNGDTSKEPYNFQKFKEVVWRLSANDANLLAEVFTALGWKKNDKYSFAHDGTTVIIEVSKDILPTQILKSLSLELRGCPESR